LPPALARPITEGVPQPLSAGDAPSTEPQQETWLARRGPLLLCLAATLPLLLPVLNPAVQLYYRDTLRLYYPVKKFIADQLALGRLPFWDPWTESGTSLLGQMSPGLLHPFTLLYAALPFDLAFKLNHLLSMPLAAAGAYLLARRLPAGRPAAAVAGIVYAGCGYLLSVTGSNLPYALGAATVPWAIAGLLWLCERPSAGRLLGAGFALALCCYAGEPQSALFAGLIGGALALLLPLAGTGAEEGAPAAAASGPVPWLRPSLRRVGLTAAWGAVALCLAAPALVPAGLRLRSSSRWTGLSTEEKTLFELHPARLLGMVVPRAFDEVSGEQHGDDALPFWEFFAGDRASFSDSSGLGAPALVLALLAALYDRRGRWLAAGGLLFALGACGGALGVYDLLLRLIPGLGLFRYSEKLLAPSALLFALAAALGAERGLAGERAPAARLAQLGFGAAALLGISWGAVAGLRPSLEQALLLVGRRHNPLAGPALVELVLPGLVTAAVLAAGLGLIALHRVLSPRGPRLSALLAAGLCAASTLTYGAELLHTANADLVRAPPPIGAEMLRRAGPSEGRWRMLFDTKDSRTFAIESAEERFRAAATVVRLMEPQLDALFCESTQSYFSLPDPPYGRALGGNTGNFARLFGVRFLATLEERLSRSAWKATPFTKAADGLYLREVDPGPRAFLVDRLFEPPPGKDVVEVFVEDAFAPRDSAVISPADAAKVHPVHPDGRPVGTASFSRRGPDAAVVQTSAPAARFLVVGEHFDAGWTATVDGLPSPVVAADGIALGLWLPAGNHEVLLRFRPAGLAAGLSIAALTTAALALVVFGRRRATFPPL
jgi:hypothetical protein